MVLSLCMRVRGGLYVNSSWWPVSAELCTDRPPRTVYRVTVPYAACIQLYPSEDEEFEARNL